MVRYSNDSIAGVASPQTSKWASGESNAAQVITFGLAASLLTLIGVYLQYRQRREMKRLASLGSPICNE